MVNGCWCWYRWIFEVDDTDGDVYVDADDDVYDDADDAAADADADAADDDDKRNAGALLPKVRSDPKQESSRSAFLPRSSENHQSDDEEIMMMMMMMMMIMILSIVVWKSLFWWWKQLWWWWWRSLPGLSENDLGNLQLIMCLQSLQSWRMPTLILDR